MGKNRTMGLIKMIRAKCLVPIVLCFLLTGCAAMVLLGMGAAVGVSGYTYYKEALYVIYQAPFTETWDASLKTLEQMDSKIELSDHGLTEGKIKAKSADNKAITISVKYKSAKETEVVIRVGWGNKEACMSIKEGIRKILFEQ